MIASQIKKYILPISTIVALAFIVYASVSQSIWLDEGLTKQFASESIQQNVFRSMTTDLHPPLYYLLLKTFTWTGDSQIVIMLYRTLSALWFLLAAYCVYRYTRNWKGNTGTIATIFFLFSPFALHYASEIRSIMFVVLVSLVQFIAFDALCIGKQEKKWTALYIMSSLIGLYTFYPIGFLLLVEFVYVCCFKRSILKHFFVMAVVIAVLYFPWMFAAVIKRLGESPGHFLSVPWWQIPAIIFLGFSGGRVPITDINHLHQYWPTALIGIGQAVNMAGLWFIFKKKAQDVPESFGRILFIFLGVIFVCLGISIFSVSIFDPRYYTELLPLFIFLSAIAFSAWKQAAPRLAPFVTAVLIISHVCAIGLYLFHPSYGREHWKQTVPQLEAELLSHDAVVFIGRFQPPPTYAAYQTKNTEIVGAYPDDLNNGADYERIEAHLDASLADNDRVWYSQFLEWQKDPEFRIRALIEQEYRYIKTIGFFKVKFDLYERK